VETCEIKKDIKNRYGRFLYYRYEDRQTFIDALKVALGRIPKARGGKKREQTIRSPNVVVWFAPNGVRRFLSNGSFGEICKVASLEESNLNDAQRQTHEALLNLMKDERA